MRLLSFVLRLIFFLLIPIFLACKEKMKFAIRTSINGELIELDTLILNTSLNGSLRTIIIDSDTLLYNINFSNPSNSKFSLNLESQSFNFSDSATIYLNTEKIKIYRFNSNFEAIDGELFHYLTEKHGLLMIRNPTWGNSTVVELWSYPILERLNLFRNEPNNIVDSEEELMDHLKIETTENER